MKYFNNPHTVEELKKQYKALALKYHPDCGGDTAIMQAVNAEYDELFNRLKNIHISAKGETYTAQTETTETPEEFRNVINAIIHLDGLNIELCGSWIWVTGETLKHKETLKAVNFRWSKSKAAWYYHTSDYKKTSKKSFTLEQIRDLYGSETIVNSKPQLKLEIV